MLAVWVTRQRVKLIIWSQIRIVSNRGQEILLIKASPGSHGSSVRKKLHFRFGELQSERQRIEMTHLNGSTNHHKASLFVRCLNYGFAKIVTEKIVY